MKGLNCENSFKTLELGADTLSIQNLKTSTKRRRREEKSFFHDLKNKRHLNIRKLIFKQVYGKIIISEKIHCNIYDQLCVQLESQKQLCIQLKEFANFKF